MSNTMSNTMSNEQLAEIEERLRAASILWFASAGYREPIIISDAVEDAIMIRHAPADIIALIAEVRRLREYRIADAPLCDECGVRHYPGANTLCRKTPV